MPHRAAEDAVVPVDKNIRLEDFEMLTLSILWVVLAATVTMIATVRKVPAIPWHSGVQTRESGRMLTLLAVIYGLTLLGGFVYVSKFLVSSL
jgi:hypothetical protein